MSSGIFILSPEMNARESMEPGPVLGFRSFPCLTGPDDMNILRTKRIANPQGQRLHMVTIDEESRQYFKQKMTDRQALRVFFGGYG